MALFTFSKREGSNSSKPKQSKQDDSKQDDSKQDASPREREMSKKELERLKEDAPVYGWEFDETKGVFHPVSAL